MITGNNEPEERKKILENFESRKVRCIVNCMVLTEGVDLPMTDAIVIMRPTCNPSLYTQIVGRGTRPCKGKDYCLVVDMIPADKKIKRRLCTAPTLFSIDAESLTKDQQSGIGIDVDLLSYCEYLEGIAKNFKDFIQLQIDRMNLIDDETEEIVSRTEGKSLKETADYYNSYRKEKYQSDDDIDFGELYVVRQPDDQHHYVIRPTYTDKITISKPDMLGNAIVEYRISEWPIEAFSTKRVVRWTGKIEDIIKEVKAFCSFEPSWYGPSWNKNIRKEWESQDATYKQLRNLSRLLDNEDDIEHPISKLGASDLIDLMQTSKDNKKNVKKLKKTLKDYTKHPEKYQEDEKLQEKENFADENETHAFQEELKKQVEAKQKKIEEEEKKSATSVEMTVFPMQKASPISYKQESLIQKLLGKFKKNNCTFDTEKEVADLTKIEASVMISFLKTVGNAHFDHQRQYAFADIKTAADTYCKRKSGLFKFDVHFTVK